MKIAGFAALLTGTLLAAETSPSPIQRPPAAERLGIVFSPASIAAAAAEPATPVDPTPIILLPKFDVREEHIDLDEREVLTAKGILEYAKRRHLSPLYQKTFGPLSLAAAIYFDPLLLLTGARPNDVEAIMLHEQEERLRRKRETEDLIGLITDLDPELSRELRRSVPTTFRLPTPLGERRRE